MTDEDDPLGASVPIRSGCDRDGCVGILIAFAFALGAVVAIILWRAFG